MGRKSRSKPRATELAAKNRQTKPDDYYRRGPLEFARFGKFVVLQNNMTEEQHRVYLRLLAERLPTVTAEIDDHVSAVVRVVQQHHPLALLHRAYWEQIGPVFLNEGGRKETWESLVAQRMVDYVQSVIAAAPPKIEQQAELSDIAWEELRFNVGALFEKLNREYIVSRTSDWTVNAHGLPNEWHEFYVRALGIWCNVTGNRYHFQEIEYLRIFLRPHAVVCRRLWGLDADQLVDGLGRILHSLSRGIGESMGALHESYKEHTRLADRGDMAALESHKAQLQGDHQFRDALDNIFSAGLFKVDDYLTEKLLVDLAWSPGECSDFIDGEEQSGWPTRIWPRTRRPFLAIDGSYYCFDVHTLFDHIYRVLQRAVLRHEPSYRHKWEAAQKETSEEFPITLFRRILPHARVWSGVHYLSTELDANGERKWCEADAVIACEDHLFVVEVKARVFTMAPPEKDFESHVNSIKRLIFDAADQGQRFLDTLNAGNLIELCDKTHNKISTIQRSDFEHTTVCAVTLDALTELAAKSEQLATLLGRERVPPFWCLSISDLMTYSELFPNPLRFLHYVEKRSQAIGSPKIQMNDELDHYGMYLQHNNYDIYATEVAGDARITWDGYRKVIDDYFDARTEDEPAKLPEQAMPSVISAIVDKLAQTTYPKRRRVASLLLDWDGHTKEQIASGIESTLKEQTNVGRPKPYSIHEDGLGFTIYCWQQGVIEVGQHDALGHAKACLMLAQKEEWMLLQLFFDDDGKLRDVRPTVFTAHDISESERGILAPRVQQMRENRLKTAALDGKLGRNDQCPCGSGKKYKKCCKP
jgi:hypothetical protein